MSTSVPPPEPGPRRLRPSRLTALLHRFRTEGDTPIRQALAIGLGLYIGATPFWGFHLLIVFVVGGALRLNRFKMYMASHISNPLIAPFLYGLEIQVGAWARTGEMHSFAKLTELHLTGVALDILVGSVIVGGVLGLSAGIATYFSSGGRKTDQRVHRLIDCAAERYLNVGLTPWEFAHGKLRFDPIYLDVLKAGVLPHEGTIVDLGCGQGLMLSLLAAARDRHDAGDWPGGWPEPPTDVSLVGLELRPRIARRAKELLDDVARVEQADLRSATLPHCTAVLIFDVLHLMSHDAQETLLREVASVLSPGGVLVLREANAAGGWRFRMVRLGNRFNAILQGHASRPFVFRSAPEWRACLEKIGFTVIKGTDSTAAAFANFVLYARTTSTEGGKEEGATLVRSR